MVAVCDSIAKRDLRSSIDKAKRNKLRLDEGETKRSHRSSRNRFETRRSRNLLIPNLASDLHVTLAVNYERSWNMWLRHESRGSCFRGFFELRERKRRGKHDVPPDLTFDWPRVLQGSRKVRKSRNSPVRIIAEAARRGKMERFGSFQGLAHPFA